MSRRCTLPGAWAVAVTICGGVEKLATALDATPRQLHFWAKLHRRPHFRTIEAVDKWFSERGLGRPTWKDRK